MQHAMQRAHDLENIFRIHQHGRIAHHLGQRRNIRRHHRSSVRHGLQRRQPKALIQRREDKDLRLVIENPQHFDRDESQKAHIVLHSAAHHGAPQIRIAGKVVPDDDQLQVGIGLLSFQFVFSAEKASIMRTTFLCGLMLPA